MAFTLCISYQIQHKIKFRPLCKARLSQNRFSLNSLLINFCEELFHRIFVIWQKAYSQMIGIRRKDRRTYNLRKAFCLIREVHQKTYRSSAMGVGRRQMYSVQLPPATELPIRSGHENCESQRRLRSG